jgi:hypothetical protein
MTAAWLQFVDQERGSGRRSMPRDHRASAPFDAAAKSPLFTGSSLRADKSSGSSKHTADDYSSGMDEGSIGELNEFNDSFRLNHRSPRPRPAYHVCVCF